MAILDELLVALGFEYDPEEAKQFQNDINNTVGFIKDLIKIAVAGATAITAFTIASTKASDEQGKLAFEIGDTTENIDAMQFALMRSGGTADGMTNSLRQLSIRASEAARGVGSGVEAFGLLGIQVLDANGKLKSTTDLMVDISKQFETLDKSRQIELADKLGVRDSIRLLQQGRGSMADLIAEAKALGVTTAKDGAISADFQDSLTDIWQITKQVSRVISRSLAPMLEEINDRFTEWWKINKDLIELKIPEWIDNFKVALKLLTVAVGGFLAFRLVSHLAALIGMLKGLTIATLAANAAAFVLPAILFALGVAFVALTEDAKVFFEGGESFIGDMLKKYPEWTDELRVAAGIFASISELTETIFDGWDNIFKLFSAGDFLETLKGITSKEFILDQLGLANVGGGGLIPELSESVSKTSSTFVDKLEIIVSGGVGGPAATAQAVFDIFQQTTQDLNSAVDQ